MSYDLEGLLARTEPSESGCAVWTGARTTAGYGVIRIAGRVRYAHRLAAELAHGDPPRGAFALHSCDNPSCVNPSHLRWGTARENALDASERGRLLGRSHYRGDQHHSSSLTEPDIRQIRQAHESGSNFSQIARAYGVTPTAISRIVRRITWKEVTP